MTNTTNPSNPFLQSNSEKTAFSHLFNLISTPALLFDRSIDQVLLINDAFRKLTGFSNVDVISKSLRLVIPEDIDTNPIDGLLHPVGVMTSNGATSRNLSIHPFLDTNKQVVLVLDEVTENGFRDELIEQERSLSLFQKILDYRNNLGKSQMLTGSLQLIHELTEARAVAVYTVNDEKLVMEKIENEDILPQDYLPRELSPEDLAGLENPLFWKPGRNILHTFHQSAFDHGDTYMVSFPLGKQPSLLGMIFISGRDNIPGDLALRYLTLIGISISGALSEHATQEAYLSNIQKLKQVIKLEHTIVDNVEEGVIVLTPDLKIAEMNPAAEIILGYNNKEVFRLPINAILIGSTPLSSAFNSAQQGITTLVTNELRLHNRNGKSFPAQVITIPVMEQKNLNSIIVLLKDTSQSEIVRVKTQQLEQRAFLGEVSAVFAHEVKNPINSIMTGLQFMGMNLDPASPHYELVTRMQNDCVRLTYLLDSVLSFSKPVEFHMTKVDLGQMLQGLLDRWNPRMRRLNITPSFESLLAEPGVIGDVRSLEQVFINLINNAVQAMEKAGGSLNIKIHPIAADKVPAMIEVTVSDSGPGIPDDIRDHIFEPFMTTNQNGTGLGLAISKRIITAHKGNIFVESFTGGTIFHVTIPKYIGDEE